MAGTQKKKPAPEHELRASFMVAFCSLMAALGTGLMMTGGLIPVLTYCSPLLAGALLIPVLREYGTKWALLVWAVTALLTLILCADKEAAFFYLFLGCYPIWKGPLDRVKPRGLSLLCKLLYIVPALAAMYGLITLVFRLDIGMEELEDLGRYAALAFYALLAVTMLIYDRALRNLALLYEYRLRPKLRRLR